MSIARRVLAFEAIAGACASLDFALWQVAAMRSSGDELAPLIARGVSAVLFGAWSGFRARCFEFPAAEFLMLEAPYLVLLTGWCAQGMMGGELAAFAAMFTALTLLLSIADFALWSLGEPFGVMLGQARTWTRTGRVDPSPPITVPDRRG